MDIIWLYDNDNCTMSDLYESGFRSSRIPFPDTIIDEDKYKLMHLKLFADGPKLKYFRAKEFVGSLFGYVFYNGPQGLGYHIDPLIMRHVYYTN